MNIVILNVLLFVVSVMMAAYILRLIRENNVFAVINRHMKKAMRESKELARHRSKKEEELRLEDGFQEKTSIFYQIDLRLLQSGLTERFSFLTTEIFLIIVLVCMLVAFLIGMQFSPFIAIVVFGLTGFLAYITLFILCSINHKKTEKQMISFVGLLKNYSRTSDDIISIMKSVSVYLEEPLKSVVTECCVEANTTGDISTAIMRMSVKVQHKEFQKIISNLEMCSRHKANYAEIIDRCMGQLRNYMTAQEELKRMAGNTRKMLIMIIFIGVIAMYMLNGLVEEGCIAFMMKTFVGKAILVYLFVVLLWAIWTIISAGNNE